MKSTRPWQSRFIRYLLGRGLSTAGTNLVTVILAFAVSSVGGTSLEVGVVLAASTVIQALLLPLGGILADWLPRNRILIISHLALAISQTAMGILLVISPDVTKVWMFVVTAGLSGAAAAIVQPASQGIMVEVVPAASLQRCNAFLRVVVNVARIAVPGLGALLGSEFGYGEVLITAGGLFLSCAVCFAMLRVALLDRRSVRILVEAKEGWAAFAVRPWLWSYVLAGTIAMPLWLAGYQLLGPLIVSKHPSGVQHWGWAVSAFAAGLLCGSLIALRWKPRRLMLAAVLVQLVWPVPLVVLALDGPLPWLILAMVVSGLSLDLSIVFYETAKQQKVPESLIGRVSSLSMLGEFALIPFGYVLAGFIATRMGIAPVVWVCFGGVFLSTACLLAVPSIRSLKSSSDRARDNRPGVELSSNETVDLVK